MAEKFDVDTTSVSEDALLLVYEWAIRFERMTWEYIALVVFQVWFLLMVIDATVHQNAAEIITLAIANILCPIIGGLQVMDARKWLRRLGESSNATYDMSNLRIALYLEIALTVCSTIFPVLFLYVSYYVVKDIGWVIYKKIGPDLRVQSNHLGMYRTFQFFVLALKIGVFVQFFVSVFYFVQLVLEFTLYEESLTWDAYYCVVVTVLIIPFLFFARFAVAAERRWRMIVFIVFQLSVIANMCYMLFVTSFSEWYSWIALGKSMPYKIPLTCTVILASICTYNFDKGLKPYVQRGGSKKRKPETDPMESQALDRHSSTHSWDIDE
ncbi:hypothetical protein BX666DRAFT_1862999 [Dichotomocladium elegans]|nr:hypothetical protein BX666DRAFT_1862999 [Dichotomocladium elegans]